MVRGRRVPRRSAEARQCPRRGCRAVHCGHAALLYCFRAPAGRNVSLRIVVTASAFVATRLGSSEIAAHQVAFTVYTTLALGLDAVAIAGQALVGRYLGAGDVPRSERLRRG